MDAINPSAARTEALAGRLLSALNGGALTMMISIGHRTGLFDAMADSGPRTSSQLAEAAGLDERYVREWLGAMLTGGIVEHDPSRGTYRLPKAHAACLTRDAGSDNLAALSQYIGLLGSVEDRIIDCFRNGGGVPYSEFPRFHEVMAEDSGMTVLPALTDAILPLVPGLLADLERGIDVLDVGCGSARALVLMARTFPNSRFRGYDVSMEGLSRGRHEAAQAGLTNLELVQQDAATFQDANRYDLITAFDAIHDQAHPRRVLANIARALRPAGVFLMQDIGASSHQHENCEHPLGTLLYTISCMHCMTVSLAYGGEGLGAMWGEEKARELLAEAGFRNVEVHRLEHDLQNHYYVNKLSRTRVAFGG